MEKFLMMFRKVNDSSNLVLCWSERNQMWGTLTTDELEMNIRYLHFWGGNQICKEYTEKAFNPFYRRIIKTNGKIGMMYDNIVNRDWDYKKIIEFRKSIKPAY